MNQKFSLAYLTVLNTPPDEIVYMAANAGYDYVSLGPIFMGLKDESNFSFYHVNEIPNVYVYCYMKMNGRK